MGGVIQRIPRRLSRGVLRISLAGVTPLLISMVLAPLTAQAAGKPNILVIFGDDIGQTNISRYSHGLVGYTTPNIDRVGAEGITFTDYYAENSCTAGRSTFITGQSTSVPVSRRLEFPAPTLASRPATSRLRRR